MEKCETEMHGEPYMLELVLFMMSSARDIITFEHYALNRLLRSLAKVLDLPNRTDSIKKDRFLDEIRREIEGNIPLTRDKEALAVFLDRLIQKTLSEYEHRLTSKREQ